MMTRGEADIKVNTVYGRIMLVAVMLTIAYVTLILDAADYKRQLNDEVATLRVVIGDEAASEVAVRAKRWFGATFVNTGITTLVDGAGTGPGIKGEQLWTRSFSRIGANLKLLMFQASLRLSLTLYWIVLLVPLVAATIADGWYLRRIKQHEFSVSSTGAFRVAGWLSIIFVLSVKFYLFVPGMVMVGPYFPLIAGAVFAITGRQMIANIAKVM